MRTIKIKSAEICGRSLKVKYTEDINGAVCETNEYTVNKGSLCHQDLLDAFDQLKPHLAMLCDLREVGGIKDLLPDLDRYDFGELLDKINVLGIKITHSLECEVVRIQGCKTSPKLRVVNLETCGISDATVDYPYTSELFASLEAVKAEIYAYLFEGKCAVKQAEMQFDEDITGEQEPDQEPEVAEEKPKRRGRKGKTAKLSA